MQGMVDSLSKLELVSMMNDSSQRELNNPLEGRLEPEFSRKMAEIRTLNRQMQEVEQVSLKWRVGIIFGVMVAVSIAAYVLLFAVG